MTTQKELVLKWVKEHGYILPAKISGTVYKEIMFGSETSKRCREMRKVGILISRLFKDNPKFEVFYLAGEVDDRELREKYPVLYNEKVKENSFQTSLL